MPETRNITEITANAHQRAIRANHVRYLADKMKREGYNPSYPLTINADGMLVHGGHRLEAARLAGISEVPVVITDESPIRHSLRCNRDGQDNTPDDVFDLAELCYRLAQEGWTGQQIADEMGWTPANVTYYSNIRKELHPIAWKLARSELTKNGSSVSEEGETVVNQELTIVNWSESHFRALLQYLPCPDGDRAIMRAQIEAINACLGRCRVLPTFFAL